MQVLIILFGVIIIAIAIYFGLKDRKKSDFDNPLDPSQIAKRKQFLDKIIVLAQQKQQITLSEVQKYLGVTESSASRYLEYLVTLGKLSQINERGRDVSYQLIK